MLGLHYAIPWPNRELATARPFRRSPVHHLLAEANACFGSRMGWERPNFSPPRGEAPVIEYSWGAQNWLPWVAAEQRATRTGVAMSTRPRSPSTCSPARAASRRCSGCAPPTWAVPPGRTVYTGMLNERGTYESDLTVTRAVGR